MSTTPHKPDANAILAGLKDFQRDTVDYVFQRMFTDAQPTRRFLVADEVGLGKTLVARGLIAKTIDHLWESVPRIDIVYICSNADIARQNIRRLNITGQDDIAFASRITLLPITAGTLTANKINFVSFTPGTSFNLGKSQGVMKERVLLYWLLQRAWGFDVQRKGPINVLQGAAGKDTFRNQVAWFDYSHTIDDGIAQRFAQALHRVEPERHLRERFADLSERFHRVRDTIAPQDRSDRNRMIGDLRELLAETCLDALEPDLIILDEFQRFKALLDVQADDEVNQLAHQLFNYANEHTATRVVLLSATPYKMYTLSQEREQADDDHYQDFLRTMRFLQPDTADTFEHLIAAYRRELLRLARDTPEQIGNVQTLKARLEARLRQVMVRTERLSASANRDGMLQEIVGSGPLAADDLRAYLTFQRVAREIDQPDTLEYWKSAPYLLNFMDAYQFKQDFKAAQGQPTKAASLATALQSADAALLSWQEIAAYRPLDPRNARLRGLISEVVDAGAWQLLWVPPALPYYVMAGPYAEPALTSFTKRLVFSSWQVVPKVIATVTSYAVERRMIGLHEAGAENTAEARARRRGLLTFSRSEGRLNGMPVLAMLYPCLTLARKYDPLILAQEKKLPKSLPSWSKLFDRVRQEISIDLQSIMPHRTLPGPEDQNWYWAAPLLLDHRTHVAANRAWWDRADLPQIWAGTDDASEQDDATLWSDHVRLARDILRDPTRLGRPPADLADVLALLALGGPGVIALRALWRMAAAAKPALGRKDVIEHADTRDAAAQVAWAFRSLFNLPEAMALIRGLELPAVSRDAPYWQRVLAYAMSGCLQAVLDEYVHGLRESLGLLDSPLSTTVQHMATVMREALGLRTVSLGVDDISVDAEQHAIHIESRRMRCHFALRFGEEKADGGRGDNRKEQVRVAFNSPFWPFVLATTSVGQEGLDFHTYCHAIVHWNLPANPVDLEQREGRIHRYKGHAVRKNVAERYGDRDFPYLRDDPWEYLFTQAKKRRSTDDLDLVPYWVFKGNAHIERHVPALPLSRDRDRLDALCRSLTLYRMVFGQNRQEDLLSYLLTQLSGEQADDLVQHLSINLEPPHG